MSAQKRSKLATLAFGALQLLFLARIPADVAAQQYTLQSSSQGANFFDDWSFYTGIDANNTGNVWYVDKPFALQDQLAFVNDAGRAIIKVDNKTDGRGNTTFGRNAVKMLSDWTFTTGNLVLFDATHMPFGCSIWPALWSEGPGEWPTAGEIDIIEGVNLQQSNRISLHTTQGCQHPPAPPEGTAPSYTGHLISTDCYNNTNNNQGCIVEVPSPNSFGGGFSQNGGGVYALQWQEDGLRFWFFERGVIPPDLSGNSPNPSGWGAPTAFYPTTSCDLNRFFLPQSLILQTTVCGNFAGAPTVFNPSCEGVCTDLIQIPENYDNAFWEVSYIKLFQRSDLASTASQTSTGHGTATTGGRGASGTPTGTGDANHSHHLSIPFGLLVAVFLGWLVQP